MLEFVKEYLSPIIIALGVVAMVINNFRKDTNGVDDRLIANYKQLDEQQKSQLADKDRQIDKYQKDMAEVKLAMSNLKESFAKDIGILQGTLAAREKELAGLRATILDPSLNLGQVLTDIRNFMEQLTKSNVDQTEILKSQQKRDDQVDKDLKDKTAMQATK